MIDAAADLAEVRRHKMAATQRLLGDTITISETDWLTPTALPGWSRGHVATHLSRNADVLRRFVSRLPEGRDLEADDSIRDLEAGTRRTPLEIQIDLDTSASLLNDTFDSLDSEQWALPLTGEFEGLTVSDLTMLRMNEVIVHHIDLDCGFGFGDVDPTVLTWLLRWNLHRNAEVAVKLLTTTGPMGNLDDPAAVEVSGSDPNLLGWLTGRLPATAVSGAESLPTFGPR